MPGIATGEVFSFAEGKLYLYASASGNTSGSGVGFAENARLSFAYGNWEVRHADGSHTDLETGRRATLNIAALHADRTLFALADAGVAVNAKFEGLVSAGPVQKSAVWVLYSGTVDSVDINQADGQSFRGGYAMHARAWSAFGQ